MDWLAAMSFRVSPYQDDSGAARRLLELAGADAERRQGLNGDAARTVVQYAVAIDHERPYEFGDEVDARTIDRAVMAIVTSITPGKAFAALRGLRPDLQQTPGALGRLRPVARAALARELRAIGEAWVPYLRSAGYRVPTEARHNLLESEPTDRLIEPGESNRRNVPH